MIRFFLLLLGHCDHTGDAMFAQAHDGTHMWECRNCGYQWPRDRGTFRPEEVRRQQEAQAQV